MDMCPYNRIEEVKLRSADHDEFYNCTFYFLPSCNDGNNGVFIFYEGGKEVSSRLRFEVFTAVTMKNAVFWDVKPCGCCKNRRFGST
jgi:hypothetical protein